MWLWILLAICLSVYLLSRFLMKKKTWLYGFYIVFWEFWSWKTRNVTTHLKYADKNTINITNYYTWYTHCQLESHNDIFNLFLDLYDFMFFYRMWCDWNVKKIFTHKQETFIIFVENYISFLDRVWLPNFSRVIKNWYISHFEDFDLLSWDTESRKRVSLRLWQDAITLENIVNESGYNKLFNKDTKFNLILDEASIYFNNRSFAENFKGARSAILEYIYQVRKFNVLFFCIVQNPSELDTKFRRLAMYFRKYYHGIWRWQWWRDFYFINPDEMNLENAEEVGGGMFSGAFFNLFPYQKLDYLTTEWISIRNDVYNPTSVYFHMNKNYREFDDKYIVN